MSGAAKGLVIAGTTSGVGKTTVATGLIGALTKRGLQVQPFKVGPDYIDPSYHTRVSGRPSRNLDTWMIPRENVVELYHRACSDADISLVEGVMGLYDGHSARGESGSTAELSKTLGLPVILVLDASGTSRSLGAMALGYKSFDPKLNLVGFLFNGISSENHYQMCREAVIDATGSEVLGYLPKRGDLNLPERHLGLVPMAETPATVEFFSKLIAQVNMTIDSERIMVLATEAVSPKPESGLFPEKPQLKQVRIAVAQDRAFNFYYQDNLDLLESWGAELVPFSPLNDERLPQDIDGVYIGGGFPEMYAYDLAQNRSMLAVLKQACEKGLPIYAECGGLMYLGHSLRDIEGHEYPMVGAIPATSHLNATGLVMGYRTVRALKNSPILEKGQEVRGHEFHWSRINCESQQESAYLVLEKNRQEGFLTGNILASYIHIHFASRKGIAQRLISLCKLMRKEMN